MSSSSKKFIFRPLTVVLTVSATILTIFLPLVQIGSWITENAVWVVWVVIAVLVVTIALLVARLEAAKVEAGARVEALAARAVKAEADVAEAETRATRLGKLDQDLAEQLWKYSSDPVTLRVLGEFFPYQIPQTVVQSIEELARLPMTRTAHNAKLADHLDALSATARQWLEELTPLVSVDGDNYTTRLQYRVSDEDYKRHEARTNKLGETGFDLHEKFLEYQRYYASL